MLLFFLIVGRTMAQQPLTFELERVSDSLHGLFISKDRKQDGTEKTREE